MTFGRALVLILVSAFACGPSARRGQTRVLPPAPPRLDRCLAAPWILADGAREAGLVRQSCAGEEGRQATLTREGTRDATEEEMRTLLARIGQRLHVGADLESVGLGLCCDRATERSVCVRTSVRLCRKSEADLARVFSEEVASLPAEARVSFSVRLVGATGPRCEPSDARCVPVAYSGGGEYDPDGDRTPIAEALDRNLARLSWGDCRHDGDCSVAGCGNQCVAWTESSMIGTCEAYTAMENAPAFCGCLNGQCTWFVQ